MATLKEFEARFCELTGEDPGSVRYVCRVLQQANILPTGKRGGGINTPQLTIEQASLFALGYYGSAEPKNAAKAASRLACLKLAGRQIEEECLNVFSVRIRDLNGKTGGIWVKSIFFSLREEWPEATFYFGDGDELYPEITSFHPIETRPVHTRPVPLKGVTGEIFVALADALGLEVTYD
jgi:hypothetical protein